MSLNSKDFLSKKLQFVILGCMIVLVIVNFGLLIQAQNNYNFISHTYNQSRSNFDFLAYLNNTIYHALYSDLRNNATIDKLIDNISDINNHINHNNDNNINNTGINNNSRSK
jgi:hypothetical protein